MSKRRVSPEDVAKCEDRYNKAKAVHSVLRHVADLRGLVLEDLSTKVSWPLYKKYGHAFDAFKLTLQDEEDVFVGLDIDEETKQAMITHIKRRLAPQPSKVRADIEVTCYTYEGIDAVKAALIAGKAVGDDRTPIQIKLIAPPRYVMDTMTLDKDLGKSVLEKAIEVVTQTIVASGGKLEVRTHIRSSLFSDLASLLIFVRECPAWHAWVAPQCPSYQYAFETGISLRTRKYDEKTFN